MTWPAPAYPPPATTGQTFSVYNSVRQCDGCKIKDGDMWWVPKKHRGFIKLLRLCDRCAPARHTRSL